MISDKLKKAFGDLTLEEKRNQISNELIRIAELIKFKENQFNIPSILQVKNYQNQEHDKLNEDEMLTFFYEDIYNIEKELVTIFSVEKY